MQVAALLLGAFFILFLLVCLWVHLSLQLLTLFQGHLCH